MIVIPAVDVLDHRVVQLVGGVPGSERIVLPDPLEAAMSWVERGAPYLHLVDLDGAFGKGGNSAAFKRIIRECGVPAEVGGGIRDMEAVDDYISAGADRVVLGTRAVRDPQWLAEAADRHPGKILLGLDTKGGRIAVKGWTEASEISVEGMFDAIRDMPLAGVLNTNVDVEGRTMGIDPAQAERFISACPHGVVASGGVTSEGDARALARLGAIGAVAGLAVYSGLMRPWEWGSPWEAR